MKNIDLRRLTPKARKETKRVVIRLFKSDKIEPKYQKSLELHVKLLTTGDTLPCNRKNKKRSKT